MRIKFVCDCCGETRTTNTAENERSAGLFTLTNEDRELKICPLCYKRLLFKTMSEVWKNHKEKKKIPAILLKVYERPLYKFVIGDASETIVFPVDNWRRSFHNFAKRRYDYWFRDHEGNRWHAVRYGSSKTVHCYPLRGKR